jgi:hypothetical protein
MSQVDVSYYTNIDKANFQTLEQNLPEVYEVFKNQSSVIFQIGSYEQFTNILFKLKVYFHPPIKIIY